MDFQNRFRVWTPYVSIDQFSFWNQGRGKLGRILIAVVIQHLETIAQGLTGNVNEQVKLGVEERVQL